jgi:hypothetical protein
MKKSNKYNIGQLLYSKHSRFGVIIEAEPLDIWQNEFGYYVHWYARNRTDLVPYSEQDIELYVRTMQVYCNGLEPEW